MPSTNYGKLSFWLAMLTTLGQLAGQVLKTDEFLRQVQVKDQVVNSYSNEGGAPVLGTPDKDDMYVEDNTSGSEDKNFLDFIFGSGPNDEAVRMRYLDDKGHIQATNVKFPTKLQKELDRRMDEIKNIYIRAFGSARNAMYALSIFRDADMRMELEKRLFGDFNGEL